MCGDSTIADDVYRLMDGKKCNLIVTSPPYYNQREYSFFKTIDDYNEFIYNVSKNLPLDKNSVICWNVGGGEVENYDLQSLNSIQLLKAGLTFSDCIVWRKSGGVFDIPRSMHITNNIYYPAFGYELIFVYKNGTMPHFEPSDQHLAREYQINVWEFRQVTTNAKEHPAAFPVKLPELCIKFYSTKNKRVFDPFGGSGSTLIACEQTHRVCYMMEIDPHYCSVIIERWENYTGKQHKKVT
jgi:DNA modification methylase